MLTYITRPCSSRMGLILSNGIISFISSAKKFHMTINERSLHHLRTRECLCTLMRMRNRTHTHTPFMHLRTHRKGQTKTCKTIAHCGNLKLPGGKKTKRTFSSMNPMNGRHLLCHEKNRMICQMSWASFSVPSAVGGVCVFACAFFLFSRVCVCVFGFGLFNYVKL